MHVLHVSSLLCGFSAGQKRPVYYFFKPDRADCRRTTAIAEHIQEKFRAADL
jgi:hypothetical protein